MHKVQCIFVFYCFYYYVHQVIYHEGYLNIQTYRNFPEVHDRENRRDTQHGQSRNRQLWAHKTQNEDKQTQNTIQKAKTMSHTNPSKRKKSRCSRKVSSFCSYKTPVVILIVNVQFFESIDHPNIIYICQLRTLIILYVVFSLYCHF